MNLKLLFTLSAVFLAGGVVPSQYVFAQDGVAKAEAEKATVYDVVLYGQKFTIDTSLVQAQDGEDNIGLEWHEIGYFIPQILPNITNGKENKTGAEVIEYISKYRDLYENLAYRAQRTLAEQIEEAGHIEVTLANLDPEINAAAFSLVREELAYGEKEERIMHIESFISDWFREGALWEDAVAQYNEKKGQEVLSHAAFRNPYGFYQYYVALSYLGTMVRHSPQGQNVLEGLGGGAQPNP